MRTQTPTPRDSLEMSLMRLQNVKKNWLILHLINAERNTDGTVFDDATSTLLLDNNLFVNFIVSTRSG